MLTPAILTLAAVVALAPNAGSIVPHRIDVDCENRQALDRALEKAQQHENVEIYVDGVCSGHYTIDSGNVTVRAAAPGSGIAAPEGDSSRNPVLEVIDAQVSLRGLIVRGGQVGVLARGRAADVLLYEVDVHEQTDAGTVAMDGAEMRLIDTTVRDGLTGIVASSGSTLNLRDVTVRNQQTGVAVANRSRAALNDTTIENCEIGGLNVSARSDVSIVGGAFRENGQVHMNANDYSSIRVISGVTIGSETDSTQFSMGATRRSSVASFLSPEIHGDVSALDQGSVRLGNTVLDGDVRISQFANIHLRNSEVTGVIVCRDGSDAICTQTTTAGAVGCASATCGAVSEGSLVPAPAAPELPGIETPGFDRLRHRGSRR